MGQMDGAGSLTLVEANCEAMPFPDASFDAVTNVYLFHEMPKEARRQAASEFARVLKPGGKLFFVDSAQVGDGKALGMEKAFDQALERFPQFNHEPYYRDYSLTDLAELFGEFGLELEDSTVAWCPRRGASRRRRHPPTSSRRLSPWSWRLPISRAPPAPGKSNACVGVRLQVFYSS